MKTIKLLGFEITVIWQKTILSRQVYLVLPTHHTLRVLWSRKCGVTVECNSDPAVMPRWSCKLLQVR
jgi:hypothetical protein